MPSGKATKPGDVVRAMSGKTIEVINTDAEGRLILADAVSYAKKLGATRVIDMATLTGAVSIALGDVNTGILGDRKSTRLNSSHANISYAVFCLKKKKEIIKSCT